MSGDWRAWAMAAGLFLTVLGLGLWIETGNLAVLIVGGIALITSLAERTYGSPVSRPRDSYWRPTSERFVDPESGRPVTVWFDPETGSRRYVADGEALVRDAEERAA